MAYNTTPIDINRGTSGVVLPPKLADEVWSNMAEQSVIMSMVPRMELPGAGLAIPLVTADAPAAWVGEATEKNVGNATFDNAYMQGYKLAVIELFSMEFRRDLDHVYDELVERLPYSIGKKFDETVFSATAPGTHFAVLGGSTAVSLTPTPPATVYDQLVTAYTTLAAANHDVTGWILSPAGIGQLLAATDSIGRPLLLDSPANDKGLGMILGAPVYKSSHAYATGTPNQVGYVGDWDAARWGMVNPGIKVSISEEATINDGTQQINLWQSNMFAVRVECEIGFQVKDSAAFVKLTD